LFRSLFNWLGELGGTAEKVSAITTAVVSFGVFVALLGGEALYARLDHANLPAADVVYDLPELRLLSVGLVELAYTGAVLVVLCCLVWVFDKTGAKGGAGGQGAGTEGARTEGGGSTGGSQWWRACWAAVGVLLLVPAALSPRNAAGIVEAVILAAVLVYLIVVLGGPVPAGDTKRNGPNRPVSIGAGAFLVVACICLTALVAVIYDQLSGTSEAIVGSAVLAGAVFAVLWAAAAVVKPHTDQIPHLQLWVIVFVVAAALTVLRQTTFPGGFPSGSVALKGTELPNLNEDSPPAGTAGLYVGKTDDEVFVAGPKPDPNAATAAGEGDSDTRNLLVYPKDSVAQIRVGEIEPTTEPDVPESLVGIGAACLLPACTSLKPPMP
jgi:hypothetical protein